MFTVIIPLYNKGKFIYETVSSVLSQSFRNFEIIIVNDGSTDNSLEVINKFKDPRIKIFNISNSGVSSARNFGIFKSTNEWIAFLDADDLWDINYLEESYKIISNIKSVNVIATNYYKYFTDYKKTLVYNTISSGFVESYLKINCITSSSVIIHKSVFNHIGIFDTRLKYGEDQHMWLRINIKYRTYFNNKPLVYYRMTDHKIGNYNFQNKDIFKDLVFFINSLESLDIYWNEYRSRYLIKYLKPYYICDNHLNVVKSLLNTVDKKYFTFLEILFYKLPRIIIKPLYKFFYIYKYS